jgi:hypothetical protein
MLKASKELPSNARRLPACTQEKSYFPKVRVCSENTIQRTPTQPEVLLEDTRDRQ